MYLSINKLGNKHLYLLEFKVLLTSKTVAKKSNAVVIEVASSRN